MDNRKSGTGHLLTGLILFSSLCAAAWAQGYPVKPVRMVVGFSPGGVADVTTRLIAPKIGEAIGQTVIVENRPGASGAIATERVATSAADGYTLLAATAADTVIPALRAKLPYNFERDLAPVALVATAPFVLVVHPSVPAHNVKQLVALARSQPGKLSYGSVGFGSTPHLSGEALKVLAGINMVHIPYKGGAEHAAALVGGQIDATYLSFASALPQSSAGRLRMLAVTSARRVSLMPSLPTLHESGVPGYDRSSWVGVLAPAGTPRDIVTRHNGLIMKIVATPEMIKMFANQGLEPHQNTPEEFAAYISRELASNAKLIQQIGVVPD